MTERQNHHIEWTDDVPTCSCGGYTLPVELRGLATNAPVEDWLKHTHATKLF